MLDAGGLRGEAKGPRHTIVQVCELRLYCHYTYPDIF
jgi:hypothetical protein